MELTSLTVWWPLVYGWATSLPQSIRSFILYSIGRSSASSSGYWNASAANRPSPVWRHRPAQLQSLPSSLDTAVAHPFTRDSQANSNTKRPLQHQLIAIDNEISFYYTILYYYILYSTQYPFQQHPVSFFGHFFVLLVIDYCWIVFVCYHLIIIRVYPSYIHRIIYIHTPFTNVSLYKQLNMLFQYVQKNWLWLRNRILTNKPKIHAHIKTSCPVWPPRHHSCNHTYTLVNVVNKLLCFSVFNFFFFFWLYYHFIRYSLLLRHKSNESAGWKKNKNKSNGTNQML